MSFQASNSSSSWSIDYEAAKGVASELLGLLQERSGDKAEQSRRNVTARRRLGTLGTMLDSLLSSLDEPGLSEAAKNRRRDQVYELQTRRESMGLMLKNSTKSQTLNERELMPQAASSGRPFGAETEQTAELDARGLLSLQNQIMSKQDQTLENMEKAISRTKNVALAIGEEVDLQTRLLDDLEDHVEVTEAKTKAATGRIRQILASSSNTCTGFMLFIVIVVFVLVLIFVLKISSLFGH